MTPKKTERQNKVTLGDPFTADAVAADQVVLNGALALRADDNDTIDLAACGKSPARPSAASFGSGTVEAEKRNVFE